MKYELTMSTNCVPDWGIWEGCREIVQNAHDEAIKNDSTFHIFYDKKNKKLKIINYNAVLNKQAMLYGYSDKKEDDRQIGMYGEGLKLGVIALLNKNIQIKIYNRNEVWIPEFINSKKFNNEKILVFNVQKRKKEVEYVSVEITPIEQESVDDLYSKILFLNKKKFITYENYTEGELIKDGIPGNLYVKGIFVENKPEFKYSYNFKSAKTDRDRNIIKSFDRDYAIKQIWTSNPVLYHELFNNLIEDIGDFECFKLYETYNSAFDDFIKTEFLTKYGEDAFPVQNLSEIDELSHCKKQGIFVNGKLFNILKNRFNINELKEQFKHQIVKEYTINELTVEELINFNKIIRLIKETEFGNTLLNIDGESNIKIVDFQSKTLYGLFLKGQILINKKNLLDFNKTLMTLVEELSHHLGDHHSANFKESLHNIYTSIIQNLLKNEKQQTKVIEKEIDPRFGIEL